MHKFKKLYKSAWNVLADYLDRDRFFALRVAACSLILLALVAPLIRELLATAAGIWLVVEVVVFVVWYLKREKDPVPRKQMTPPSYDG
jgi:hypothetical protein